MEDCDAISGWTISTLKALLVEEALKDLSPYKIAQLQDGTSLTLD